MLVLKLHLNHAVTKMKTELLEIKIANLGTGTSTIGNYRYEIRGKKGHLMKVGHILGYPRKRKHAIKLLQLVINDAYPEFST